MDFQPFVTGHCYATVFACFLIACLVGTYWEQLLYLIQHHERVTRTGTVIGPFSPIYGYGAAAFAILLGPFCTTMPWWGIYLVSCLIGGVAEYIMSLVADKVFHETIWDYSERPLNIRGRTTIPFMLGWGVGGFVLMYVLYPQLIRLLALIPAQIGTPVLWVMTVFMAVNLFLTYGAIGRQTARAANKPAGVLGRFFDRYYPLPWLKKRFPAITFAGERPEDNKK